MRIRYTIEPRPLSMGSGSVEDKVHNRTTPPFNGGSVEDKVHNRTMPTFNGGGSIEQWGIGVTIEIMFPTE